MLKNVCKLGCLFNLEGLSFPGR